ncbi:MAG: 50S ribosomal protein L9 [Phycisphaerales bacterium]
MAKTVELLLTETVENLGIVGDVVKVRVGYARNYLLPREYATEPSEELKKSLQAKRVEAEKMLAEQQKMRAETVERLAGYELSIERACNDLGILYAAVTQQEISAALSAAGYAVRPRDVRLSGAIKRVDKYDVHIKYQTDLETWIKLNVKPDRVLSKDEKADLDFDNEGNLIEKRPEKSERKSDAADKAEKKPAAETAEKAAPAAEEPAPQKATRKPRQDVKKEAAPKA